ncbi:hypothetical protein MKW98_031179 [Papaver atlanticum]|uniref:SHSP domain-containing protein n=1 Tax=Papaver atlanticum TaxID=357466 RepID=A0AAD4T305_9MAGN|nr:hypothetical protein MKW98_031179 [Papaver atlanticum]
MAFIFMAMSKNPAPTTVVSSNTLKNKLGLLKNHNPKHSAASFVPICSSCSFPLNMMKTKKGSQTCDALRPSFTTDLLGSDIFDYDMEEVKLYDKEEKDVTMKRWSAKELKEGIELKINLPGFRKDDIKVSVEGTSLVITTLLGKEEDDVLIVGPDVNEDDMKTFISFGLDLDFLNLQELKAEMKNGLLKISIPKKQGRTRYLGGIGRRLRPRIKGAPKKKSRYIYAIVNGRS